MSRWILPVLAALVFSAACSGSETEPSAAPGADPPGAAATAKGAETTPQSLGKFVRVPAEAQEPAAAGTDLVRVLTRQFYFGELEELHGRFTDEMKADLTLERLGIMHAQMLEKFGEETRVIAEKSKVDGEYRGFVRWAEFDKHEGVIEVLWILRADDAVAGFYIRPAQPPGT